MIGLWYISEHVNEYLRLAACADKQQLQRIKIIFWEEKSEINTDNWYSTTEKIRKLS